MQGRTVWTLTIAAGAVLVLAGLAPEPKKAMEATAKATIEARSDSTVTGTATFSEPSAGGVRCGCAPRRGWSASCGMRSPTP